MAMTPCHMTTAINLWCWEVLKTRLTPFGMVSRKNKTVTRPLVVNLMQSGTKVNMAAQYMIYVYWVTPECLVIVIPLNVRLLYIDDWYCCRFG